MKKTFISLFLLSLLTVFGSLSVKADTTLSFIFESPNGGSDEDCNGNTINDWNAITTSDFHFSSALYNEVKKQSSYLGKSWTSFKAGAKACTRNDVHLEAGSYTFTLKTAWMYGNNNTRVPIIRVNNEDYSIGNVDYADGEEVDLEYTVSIPSTNDYPILITCVDGEADKFCMRTLTITPNCTQHTVTVAADDNNKGTVAGGGSYCDNSVVTVTATPKPGYNFVNWTDNNNSDSEVSTNASYTFTLTANVNYRANFSACSGSTVTVVANNAEYGTATGGGSYCAGVQVDLEATPKSGYRFVNWTVTSGSASLDNENNASTHFTMSNPAAAVTVRANFEEDPCVSSLTLQVEDNYLPNGAVTGGNGFPSHLTFKEKNTNSDYRNHSNGRGYVSTEEDTWCEIHIPVNISTAGNYKVMAHAGRRKNMKIRVYSTESGGDATVSYNSTTYYRKTEKLINDGNDADDFQNSDYTDAVALPVGVCLIGLFSEWSYAAWDQITITRTDGTAFCPNAITMAKVGDEGAAAPTAQVNSSNVTTAFEGVEVTVTAGAPSDANHYFSGWTVLPENAVTFANPANATTTFSMPASDVTITANYGAVVSSELTFSAVEGGSITSATAGGNAINSGAEVISGTSVTLTAEANSNYVFINWTDNNNSDAEVSTNAAFTFSMPATATSYTANFAQIDNVIITGDVASTDGFDGDGNGTMNITSVADFDAFNHNVLKFAYSNMSGNYKGKKIFIDEGYISSASAQATGFGFYYKTEKEDDHVAFCFEVASGQQVKWQLAATNNVWKYFYFPHAGANSWSGGHIAIFMNGSDNGNYGEWEGQPTSTNYPGGGAFYMSEIAATSITSKADIDEYHYTYDRGGNMAVDDYGTLCLPMGGTISGATLYSLAGKETKDEKLYIVLEDEGNTVVAGKPYITQSTATSYTVTMSGPYSNVQAGNGLVGTYTEENLTPYDDTHHNYFLYANAFKKAGTDVTVGAYRAYLNLDAVGAVTPAPSARRIRMVIEGTNSATGLEDLINDQLPVTSKVLIEGQLFIIREGKRYTLTGARVQ